jgi:hypothetical protein
MIRKSLPVFAFLALIGLTAAGDQPAPSGVWERKNGDHLLFIEFGPKDALKITASHGDKGVTVTCTFSTTKEGVVKGKITELEERGINIKEKLPVGTEFSFTWEVKGDTATMGNMKSEQGQDILQNHLEGTFDRKK